MDKMGRMAIQELTDRKDRRGSTDGEGPLDSQENLVGTENKEIVRF